MAQANNNSLDDDSEEETYRLVPVDVSRPQPMVTSFEGTSSLLEEESEPQGWLQKVFRFVFRDHLPMETETSIYILVSALDLIFTIILLNRGGFRESNPIALYVLSIWGIKGMIVFKMLLVSMILIVTQIVVRQRPTTARMILYLGTFVVSLVLIHSSRLLLSSF